MGRHMMMDGMTQHTLRNFISSEDGLVSEAQHAQALQKVQRAQGETVFAENFLFGTARLIGDHEDVRTVEGAWMIGKSLVHLKDGAVDFGKMLLDRMSASGGKESLDASEKILREMEKQLSPEHQSLLAALRGMPRETQTRVLERMEQNLSGKPGIEDWKAVRELIRTDSNYLAEHNTGLLRALAGGYRPTEADVFELEKRFRSVLRSPDLPPETAQWVSRQLDGAMQMRGLMTAHDPLSPQLQQSIERNYQLVNFGVGRPSVDGPAAGSGAMTMTIPVSFQMADPLAPGGRRRYTASVEVTGVEGRDPVNITGLSRSFVPEQARVILSDTLKIDLGKQAQQAGLSSSALTQNRAMAILGALEAALEGEPNGALKVALAATPHGRLLMTVQGALETAGVDVGTLTGMPSVSSPSSRESSRRGQSEPHRSSAGLSIG